MKKSHEILIPILIALFLSNNLFCQEITKNDSIDNSASVQVKKSVPALKVQKLNYSMELGAGYISGGNLFSGTYTNIAPSINYMISPKFKIEVGGIFTTGNTNFTQNSILKTSPNFSLNTNQYFVYTQGQYAVSNKLVISGSLFSTLNSNKSPQMNPYFLDYKGMNLGLDYKIGKNMSVGAQFRISNGNNNYLFDQPGTNSFSHFGQNNFGW